MLQEKAIQALDGRCPAARATGGHQPQGSPASWGTGKPAHQGRLSCAGKQPGALMPSARPLPAENRAQCTWLIEEMDGEEEGRGLRFGPRHPHSRTLSGVARFAAVRSVGAQARLVRYHRGDKEAKWTLRVTEREGPGPTPTAHKVLHSTPASLHEQPHHLAAECWAGAGPHRAAGKTAWRPSN